MTLTIPLSPEAEAKLRARAAAAGQNVAEYAARLFEQAVTTPSVDEALAPFRREVADSGLTDGQLDEFFEEMRDEAWRERQGPRP